MAMTAHRKNPLHLRIFISSPGDVNEERRITRKILQELPLQPVFRGEVTIEVVAWDDPDAPSPMVANETPQASVNRFKGRPSECDLTIVILWGRFGTPLPADMVRADQSRFSSGTEWEYEDACAAGKTIWIYRRSEKPRIEIDDPQADEKRRQFQSVTHFFEQFKNPDNSFSGGINFYKSTRDFRTLLQKQIEAYVSKEIKTRGTECDKPADNIPNLAQVTPLLVPEVKPDHKIVGREQLVNDLWERVKRGESPCLVVLPGIGKTAVAFEILRDRERILQNFEGILWANLGRHSVILEELVKWADALQLADRNKLTGEADWKKAIRTTIGQRRLLIVLDDIYQTKKALEFRELGCNCVYIMTTRRRDVAEELARQELVTVVKELDDAVGLDLLRDIAPKAVASNPAAAQTLVKMVQGLPLALVLLGRYLKKMSSQEDPDRINAAFDKVRQAGARLNLKLADADEERSLADIIDVSYGALESEQTRRAFLALSIFRPKPNTFGKEIAEQICSATADTIYELSDIGLIEHCGGGSYAMHRVIAEYGRKKLDELEAECSVKLHSKALDYYARKLGADIDQNPNAYLGNYRMEQADWQTMKDAWLYHLANTGDMRQATLAFLQVYFDAFWWWGYYQRFPFCDALIREWQQRDITPEVRKTLDLLNAFQDAYPAGHEKRGKGNWSQVEGSLRGIRKQLKLEEETRLQSKDARRVRAFTDFFLAETYAYGRIDQAGALTRYHAAHDLFSSDGHQWEAAWIWFYVGHLLLENKDFPTARDYAMRSLAAANESLPLAQCDPELLANNYRLLGDLGLATNDLQTAIRRYQRSAFYAYAFQGIPEAADSYTMAFYEEITTCIAAKAASLYHTNQQQGLKLCNDMREFWAPYRALYPTATDSSDWETIFKSQNLTALAANLFPPRLADHEIKEGAANYQKQVLSVVESLQQALEKQLEAGKSLMNVYAPGASMRTAQLKTTKKQRGLFLDNLTEILIDEQRRKPHE